MAKTGRWTDAGSGSGDGWLVEVGIGEHRALLIRHGEAIAARLEWPGLLAAGLVEDARLVARTAGSSRGTVCFNAPGRSWEEMALVDHLPRDACEGAVLRVEITRASIVEAYAHAPPRRKAPQCRPTQAPLRDAPTLAERLGARVVRCFPTDDWDEVAGLAWNRVLTFAGGEIVISPTPALCLIDVDGSLPARALALAAVPAIARAIRLLDLAGSIAVDFPTLADKADRRAVDAALARALGEWPHERTAMNGFGLVQLVSRMIGPSLCSRIASDRAAAAARTLLRRAERVADPGAILLVAHPLVRAGIPAPWLEELARRTGRSLQWVENPGLALNGGFAQAVPR